MKQNNPSKTSSILKRREYDFEEQTSARARGSKASCIYKIWTESGKKIIFGTNIQTPFRYIDYLDIFMFLHIKIKIIQTREDPTQTSYINF